MIRLSMSSGDVFFKKFLKLSYRFLFCNFYHTFVYLFGCECVDDLFDKEWVFGIRISITLIYYAYRLHASIKRVDYVHLFFPFRACITYVLRYK